LPFGLLPPNAQRWVQKTVGQKPFTSSFLSEDLVNLLVLFLAIILKE